MKTIIWPIRGFPVALKKEVKMQALSEDKSIAEWLVEAIQEKLKQSDKGRRFP